MNILYLIAASTFCAFTCLGQVQLDKSIQFTGSGSNAKIEGIGAVSNNNDAANKIYVDTAIANRTGSSSMTFTVSLSKSQDTILLGTTAISKTYQVIVTRTSGNGKPVFLKVSGLPAGVSYSLQPGGYPSFTANLILTINSYTNLGSVNATNAITVYAYDDVSTQTATLNLTTRGAIVFITNNVFTGSLGGSTGADNLCTTKANGAGLPSIFIAMVSDGTSNFKDRLTTDHLWVNMAGTIVATGRTALLSTPIPTNTIDITETGGGVATWETWTNTTNAGNNNSSNHCSNWTSNSSGLNGQWGRCCGGGDLYNYGTRACNLTSHLFCFEK